MGVAQGIGTGVAGIASSIGQVRAQEKANAANLEIARQNNETSTQLARENNQLQVDMMRENNDFNRRMALDMFDLETSYNRPLEQVKRYREAGLNPALMMEGAGAVASGNGDASTPSASPSGISPVMPTLTTPHIEPVPPLATGFIQALNSLAQIQLATAEAKKKGAETFTLEQMLPHEISNLLSKSENQEANTYYLQAQTEYQELITRLEETYGSKRRGQELVNMVAEYALAISKGETERAQKLFLDVQRDLTSTRNENERIQAPIILENLKKTGRSLEASAAASRAAARASDAAAEEHRAGASLKHKEVEIREIDRRILSAQEDDIIFARRLANAKDFQELGEMVVTFEHRLEQLRRQNLISDEVLKEARSKAEMARKENNFWYWNQYLHFLESTSGNIGKIVGAVKPMY